MHRVMYSPELAALLGTDLVGLVDAIAAGQVPEPTNMHGFFGWDAEEMESLAATLLLEHLERHL